MFTSNTEPFSVSICGSGFIARGLTLAIRSHPQIELHKVLTRRPIDSCTEFPRQDCLTLELDELLEGTDVLVECSGDVLHATNVVNAALERFVPVVTMNAEFQVTTGSAFVGNGYLTEAEGDQPGSLAALQREAVTMGFRPIVYGNLKGFLDHNPPEDSMRMWARKQGISLSQVTSFTDGTKLQIEQALVANGLGADILQQGLTGLKSDSVEDGGQRLAELALPHDVPVSDYLLSDRQPLPAGVFLAATHHDSQQPFLQYLKMGDGPVYVLVRNYHLCHLEALRTICAAYRQEPPLLTNSATPSIGVTAIAKRRLRKGATIERGIGSFDVRGEAVRLVNAPNHVPIGLLSNARLRHEIAPGDLITYDDVELPESLAFQLCRETTGLRDEQPCP